MRTPTITKPQGRQEIATIASIPAPVGGLNAQDSLASMPETDAIVLDNWFPRTGYCEIRGGYASHATGMTGNGKTLMPYNNITGTHKLFCATSSGVYDVTNVGAVGASIGARTNGKHRHLIFGDGTNNWLIAVNGDDKPLYYDGTTWIAVDGTTSPALTGVTTTDITTLAIHKGRLLFGLKNSIAFYYLAAGAAGGALTKFDLSGVAQKGGYLMAMISWTVDGGSGPDDRMVFITSEGEVIIYQGTNPSSASSWALIGIYTIAAPLGRHCVMKAGTDVLILTREGAFSLITVANGDGQDAAKSISRKIQNDFNNYAKLYGSTFGWKAILYNEESALIINIPTAEDGTHYQYVMNIQTQSWCRFTGWHAEDFAVLDNVLYFCHSTGVYKAWTGTNDNGGNIEAIGKSAFSYFGNKITQKNFKLFRPVLNVTGALNFLADIDTDYENHDFTGSASYGGVTTSLWGTALWGVSLWSSSYGISKKWQTPNEWTGYCAAGKIKIVTNDISAQWISTDFIYENGGIL